MHLKKHWIKSNLLILTMLLSTNAFALGPGMSRKNFYKCRNIRISPEDGDHSIIYRCDPPNILDRARCELGLPQDGDSHCSLLELIPPGTTIALTQDDDGSINFEIVPIDSEEEGQVNDSLTTLPFDGNIGR